jgi:hypothetical protein
MSETVEWRRDVNMADLSFRDCPEFVQNEFAYISTATDITHRPVVFLTLQNFPLPPKKRALADHIQPFACLLMEAARKLTYDISKKLEQEGRDIQLVSQVTIVVNIAKAPLIPIVSLLSFYLSIYY